MKRSVWFPAVSLAVLSLVLGGNLQAAPPVVRSLHFSNTRSDVVSYSYQPWMNSNVAMTVEAWIYREDATRCETILSHDFRSSFWFGLCPRLRFYRSGGSADATVDVPAKQWTHVAASYDGSRVRFFINGNAAGDVALANTGRGPNNLLHVGGVPETDTGGTFASGYYFKGYLDEVRLWSAARTQTEIRAGMFQELREGAALVAAFANGGVETIHGVPPTTFVSASRLSGFGLLPRNLVIPRATAPMNFNGSVDRALEYGGAEQMVIRYNSGPTEPDAVAYLVYRNSGTDRYLYIGIDTLREPVPGRSWSQSFFEIWCDPNGSRTASRAPGDFTINSPIDGAPSGWLYTATAPGIAFFNPSPTSWEQALSACNGDLSPWCREIRIHASRLGDFGNVIGMMLNHSGIRTDGDSQPAPGDATPTSPATWAEARFGDAVSTGLKRIIVSGAVSNVVAHVGLEGHRVLLYSGADLSSRIFIGEATSAADGTFSFEGQALPDRPVLLKLEERSDFTYLAPEFPSTTGTQPSRIERPTDVVFDVCATATCTLTRTLFRAQPPPSGPMRISSFTPASGPPLIVVRETPRRTVGGTSVRLFGANLHNRVTVYLSRCTLSPPSACTEGVDIFPITVIGSDPDLGWIDVRIDELPPNTINRGFRWIIEDHWIGRPGWSRWNYADAAAGEFMPTLPPYPFIHGFDFPNDGDGPSVEDFEATYGESVFTFIPVPPFKVRDPYYYAIWFPIYLAIGGASGEGNCHGIAATSRMFERGILNVASFDTPSSGGPGGIRYAIGFPGRYMATSDGVEYQPWKPAMWSGFDLFHAFEPRNLWAQIRVNMMAQFSDESIGNVLSQIDFGRGFAGDPVAVLNRVRSSPTAYILCFNPGGIGTGHCVTPYAVVDNFRLDASLEAITPAANFSIIKIYDNNWPNAERFMEIDRTANTYRYLLGFSSGAAVVWSSQSLYTTPLSLFTSARHAPGATLLGRPETLFRMIVAGGADVQHSDAAGGTWGWDASGKFESTYAGANAMYAVAGFYPDRDKRTGITFLPANNPPVSSKINVRGNSNYVFHASLGETTVQFVAENVVPGSTDSAKLIVNDKLMNGYSFKPQNAISSARPMLSRFNAGGGSTVHILIGLSLPAAHEIELRALPDQQGVSFVNRGGTPLNYSFLMQSVDSASGIVSSNRFGPFDTPAGAAHLMSLPDWPKATQLKSQLDLGANGSIEKTEFIVAAGALIAEREDKTIVLRWTSSSKSEVLEASDSLGNDAKWAPANLTIESNGTSRTARIAADAQVRYFRVRP